MNDIKVYNKKVPGSIPTGGLYSNPVVLVTEPRIGPRFRDSSAINFDRVFKGAPLPKIGPSGTDYSKHEVYGGAIHVPQKWADGRIESVYERVISGRIKADAKGALTGNTLLPDWAQLWDAMRMDLTIRKNALPTVRQFLYNVYVRPDADKKNNLTEMLPYGIVFEKNNGTGQPIRMGDKGEGQNATVDIELYAAGFTWDLLAKLFDKSLDMTALNDAVAVGYNAKLDDLAIRPIFEYGSYGNAGTAKHTAASTISGARREELLYTTLANALDDLGKRKDPSTQNKIDPTGSYLLCSGNVARHAARVINGLPQNTGNVPLGALSEIAGIIAYDGDTVIGRDGNTVYEGVGDTYAYLVKPNRYLDIIVKQGLTAEIDPQPDVMTLAQEQRAWWFAEGVYNDEGLANYVQKITLPAW
jgi:hypothetical protein